MGLQAVEYGGSITILITSMGFLSSVCFYMFICLMCSMFTLVAFVGFLSTVCQYMDLKAVEYGGSITTLFASMAFLSSVCFFHVLPYHLLDM